MKAVSLWQFWASAVALGEKRYETRGWATPYRGDLLIHAAKRPMTKDDLDFFERIGGIEIFGYHSMNVSSLPYGAALCVVNLVACHPTNKDFRCQLSVQEFNFGNFSDGRFAWEFRDLRPLREPLPLRGQQGLWNVDDALIRPLFTNV